MGDEGAWRERACPCWEENTVESWRSSRKLNSILPTTKWKIENESTTLCDRAKEISGQNIENGAFLLSVTYKQKEVSLKGNCSVLKEAERK